MHRNLFPKHFGADDCILRKVLRNPSSDHKKAGGRRLHLDSCQLKEILDRVNAGMLFSLLLALCLVQDKPESS